MKNHPRPPDVPSTILVMGVCGCGKSSFGRLLAERLGADFVEGDDFHPPANVAKMSRGIPLDDADRAGWLERLHAVLVEGEASGRSQVLACSALKRSYRAQLAAGLGDWRVVFLNGPRSVLEARLAARTDHFMPPALLDSQLATLEPPLGAVEGSFALPLVQAVVAVHAQLVAGGGRGAR